jgi:cobalt-zinc-cadmium efflux system membrane fusion protein
MLLLGACAGQKEAPPAEAEQAEATDEVQLSQAQFKADGMRLGELESTSFSSRINARGKLTILPQDRASVSSYYPGFVKRIRVVEGQWVNQGAPLLVLSHPDYLELQQEYLQSASQMTFLEDQYQRQQDLLQDSITSRKAYLQAEAEYQTGLARLAGLAQKLRLLGIDADQLKADNFQREVVLRAPISGYVSDVRVQTGQLLSPENIAFQLLNSRKLQVRLHVFESDWAKVKKGQTFRFHLPGDVEQRYQARIFSIGQEVDQADRMLQVLAKPLADPIPEAFVAGMYVEGEILMGEHEALSLPAEAVVEREGKHFVLVKKSQEGEMLRFEPQLVEPGLREAGRVELLGAEKLKGAKILVKGAFRMIQ